MDKRIEHEAVEWAAFCREVLPQFKELAPVFGLSSTGLKGNVLRLKIPYGTQLIEDGRFQWRNIPKGPFQDDDFSGASIPLGLVLSRTIELYDKITILTGDDDAGHSPVRRSIPLFLLPKGNFFGLFQAFCDDFKQPLLQATSGGTTLVLMPRIGNAVDFRNYAKHLGMSQPLPWAQYSDHLKSNNISGFQFGQLFTDVVAQSDCGWRLELALFPNDVVARLRTIPSAHECLLRLTLNQMRLSHERSESTIQVLRSTRNSSHMHTARIIARGLRPGFSPVFTSEEDMEILPARAIYDFIYGKLDTSRQSDNGARRQFPNSSYFYPAVFRPSFMDEPSFYFLNWPYKNSKIKKNKVAVHVHLTEIEGLKKVEPGVVFDCADRERLVELLESEAARRTCPPEPLPAIKLGEGAEGDERSSYFIDGGVVYIARRPHGKPPC